MSYRDWLSVWRGGAENAGVENAAPDGRGWKTRELKSMESQKSPLFSIVTSVLQQPLELMWTRRTLRIYIFLLYKQSGIVSPYPVLRRPRETDSLVACKVLRYVIVDTKTREWKTLCVLGHYVHLFIMKYSWWVDGYLLRWMFLAAEFSLKHAQCVTRLQAYVC